MEEIIEFQKNKFKLLEEKFQDMINDYYINKKNVDFSDVNLSVNTLIDDIKYLHSKIKDSKQLTEKDKKNKIYKEKTDIVIESYLPYALLHLTYLLSNDNYSI